MAARFPLGSQSCCLLLEVGGYRHALIVCESLTFGAMGQFTLLNTNKIRKISNESCSVFLLIMSDDFCLPFSFEHVFVLLFFVFASFVLFCFILLSPLVCLDLFFER